MTTPPGGPALLRDPARAGVAEAAVPFVKSGMSIGLGSGRAVWALIELLSRRAWDPPLAVVTASSTTERLARSAGFELFELDGKRTIEVVIDGADEIDDALDLIKGQGAALLREKLLVVDAERFVVIAEASKRVRRLGETQTLPIEVVRFGWPATNRRLGDLLPKLVLRTHSDGTPVVTDEGNLLLDATLPADCDLPALAAAIVRTVGVIEHGLFLGMSDDVLLGAPDGRVEHHTNESARAPRHQPQPPWSRGSAPIAD